MQNKSAQIFPISIKLNEYWVIFFYILFSHYYLDKHEFEIHIVIKKEKVWSNVYRSFQLN